MPRTCEKCGAVASDDSAELCDACGTALIGEVGLTESSELHDQPAVARGMEPSEKDKLALVPGQRQESDEALTVTSLARPSEGSEKHFFVYQPMTKQTHGPLTEVQVKQWLLERRISLNDQIHEQGGPGWTAISQSRLATAAVAVATIAQVEARACPQCGAGMAVVLRRSRLGLILIILGLILTPAFGIGIPIFIVGFAIRWGGKGTAGYVCPRCNFTS
jgi:hypothetical protein